METNPEKMPSLPSRFIETNIVENMKVGEFAFIGKLMCLRLDENKKLWVRGDVEIEPEIETEEEIPGEKEELPLLFTDFNSNIRIKRLEKGFKLYLYEHYTFLQEKRFNCDSFTNCNAGIVKNCHCKKSLRSNLFHVIKYVHEKDTYLPIIAFDEPGQDINDPDFYTKVIEDLSILQSLNTKDLNILLANSTEDERFDISILAKKEIDNRK